MGENGEDEDRLDKPVLEDAKSEDQIYPNYVRESIEVGLKDVQAGRVISTDEVRRRLGLLESS